MSTRRAGNGGTTGAGGSGGTTTGDGSGGSDSAAVQVPRPTFTSRLVLPPLPILGKDEDFVDWLPRVKDRMEHYDLVDWRHQRELILTATPHADHATIRACASVTEAFDALKATHAPNDNVQILQYRTDLNQLRFQANEPVYSLIQRARTLSTRLRTLGVPITEEDVRTAVVSAIRQHPVYSQHLATLLALNPGVLTMQQIQSSFAVFSNPNVPGAFTVAPLTTNSSVAAPPPAPPATVDTDRMVRIMTSLADKVAASVGSALAITSKASAGGTPAPSQDRAGAAQKTVRFDTGSRRDRSPAPSFAPSGSRGGSNRDRSRSPARRDPPTEKRCRNCGAKGHLVRDCREPCDLCGSKDHPLTRCPGNKSSMMYDPSYNVPRRSEALSVQHEDPYGHMALLVEDHIDGPPPSLRPMWWSQPPLLYLLFLPSLLSHLI